jgi:hypothetical protein
VKKLLIFLCPFILYALTGISAPVPITKFAGDVVPLSDSLIAPGACSDTLSFVVFRLSSATNPISTLFLQYEVSTIDTSVTLILEASLDGVGWVNTAADSTTITTTGTYGFWLKDVSCLRYIRLRYISDVGSAAVIRSMKVLLGG